MSSPETCPNCGADVPPNARSCPECGSCDETGWSEQAHVAGLGLPDEDFDYGNFVKREFGEEQPAPRGIAPFWWVVAILIVILVIAIAVRLL